MRRSTWERWEGAPDSRLCSLLDVGSGASGGGVVPPPPGAAPCFNILNFGGHADNGATDNTPAVVAAFNAAIVLGAGYIEFSDDPAFPGGFYDMQTAGAPINLGVPGEGLFGMRSTGGCIQRIRISAGIGVANNWLTIIGTSALFDMNDLAFFSVDDTVPFCGAMIEWGGCRLSVENVILHKVANRDQTLFMVDGIASVRGCIVHGGNASAGNGLLTFRTVNWAKVEACQFFDSTTTPEANIRVQDPGEDPNVGAWSCSFIMSGCVFGEVAKYTLYVEPNTLGERFPYVEVTDCCFQPNGGGAGVLLDPTQASACIRLTRVGNAKINNCVFTWQEVPMQMMVVGFDAGDVELNACTGVVAVRGGVALGVQRIYADAATKSLTLRDCTYSYIDSKCPDITIERGGQTIAIVQSNLGDPTVQRAIVDDTADVTLASVAANGGTGSAPIFMTPGCALQIDSNVSASAGLTDPDIFAAESTVQGSNVAAVCRVSGQFDSLFACDTAFQSGGGVNSSATYAPGAGATADEAVLTITNQSTSPKSFTVKTTRRRTFSLWHPGLLMGDIFGPYSRFPPAAIPLIAGWYDHATLVNTGGLVGTWKDRSGQHNDLSAAGAARPVYTAVGNNGLPQADFAGSQVMSAVFSVPWQTGGAIFTVGTFTGDNQTHAGVAAAAGVFGAGDWTLFRKPVGLEDSLLVGGGEATVAGVGTFSTRLASAYAEGTNLWIDGVALATSAGAQPPSTVASLKVGNRQGGGFPLTGSLQLVMIFTQVPPVTLVAQLQAWAKAIYATP